MKKEYRNLLIISIFFLCYILLFISKFDYNLSATIELSEENLKRFKGSVPSELVVQVNSRGFDGQFYYMMAIDPTLRKVDVPSHFSQRIFYPFLAYVLSLGITPFIPFTLLFINYVSLILSSYILMLMLKKYKANLNLVFLWAFNIGFLVCIVRDLTTPLMALFIIAALYYQEKGRNFIPICLFALALLTREFALSIYTALLLYFFIKLKLKKIGLYFLAIIPFITWGLILSLKATTAPLSTSLWHLAPFTGVINYLYSIPSYIKEFLVPILSEHTLLSREFLKITYLVFGWIPILIFALIQLIIMMTVFLKDKKMTKYFILLLFQVIITFSINMRGWIEMSYVGRCAVPMFLFAIIYYAEKREQYNRSLKVLSLALVALSLAVSIAYFIEKNIIFRVDYYIS